jgi:hypothetical protein
VLNWTLRAAGTHIIHRRTDNDSASARRTFWQVYNTNPRHELGDRLCAHFSESYRQSQTDPQRIALLDDSAQPQREQGKGYWRLEELDKGHNTWPYRLDEVMATLSAGRGRGASGKQPAL